MEAYILIVILWGYESSVHEHIEFSSKATCQAAVQAIKNEDVILYGHHSLVMCVKK